MWLNNTIAILSFVDSYLLRGAEELQDYLGQMSGDVWQVVSLDPAGAALRLVVDENEPTLTGLRDEAVSLFSNNGLTITSKTSVGVRHGAYILLEKLGVRWFFKHRAWHIVPPTLVDPGPLNEVHQPAFSVRGLWHGMSPGDETEWAPWLQRNRQGAARAFPAYHNYFEIIPKEEADARPDMFLPEGSNSATAKQLVPDNPDVIVRATQFALDYLNQPPKYNAGAGGLQEIYSVPVSPNDGWGWGAVEGDVQAITDMVFGLVNEVARAVAAAGLTGRYVSVYNYSWYSGIPSFPLEPNILTVITTAFNLGPLTFIDRLAGMAAKGVAIAVYEYFDVNVWYRNYPPNNFYKLLSDIDFYARMNVEVMLVESTDGWGDRGLLYYVSSKLYWDPQADVAALLDDFYTKSFGPAAATMKRYYDRWWNGADVANTSLAAAFNDLAEAEALAAGDPAVLERVRQIQYYLRYLWFWFREDVWDYDYVTVPGKLTLAEAQQFYTFITKIRELYLITYPNIEGNIRQGLQMRGMSSAEIDALIDDTPPTEAEAAAWMVEAQTYFDNLGGVGIITPNPYTMSLGPLGDIASPKQPLIVTRDLKILVPSPGGEVVRVLVEGTGTLRWEGPNGFVLANEPFSNLPAGSFIDFGAVDPGNYTLALALGGWAKVDVPGRPASIMAGPVPGVQAKLWTVANSDLYFYVPAGTLAFELRSLWATLATPNTFILTPPSGVPTTYVFTADGEEIITAPEPGLWLLSARVDSDSWFVHFGLAGVPPLLWHDPQYLLVPAIGPGPATRTVTIAATAGGTTTPVPGSYPIDEGTDFSVEAFPDPGYQFDGWTGGVVAFSNPLIVTVLTDLNLVPNFSLVSPPATGMTLVGDITNFETGVGMVEFLGKLYIAVHSGPTFETPGAVIRYDDSSGLSEVAFTQPAPHQGLGDIRVLNGVLYVTNLDPYDDKVYVYWTADGYNWDTIVGPSTLRLYDIELYQGRFYFGALQPPRGSSTPMILSTPDFVSWETVYNPQIMTNFVQLAVFNSKLFFSPTMSNFAAPMDNPYEIFSYDGVAVTPIDFATDPMMITDLKVFNGALYLTVGRGDILNTPGMYRTLDGVNFVAVPFFGPDPAKAPNLVEMQVFGDSLYVAEFEPGTVRIYRSSDGLNWVEEFTLPATDSVFPTTYWFHVAMGVYNNRLYSMPPAAGGLYASDPGAPGLTYTLGIGATAGGTTLPTPGSYVYAEGDEVIISATPLSGYTFVEWQEDGVAISSEATTTVVMTGNRNMMAVFAPLPAGMMELVITTIGQGTTDPPPDRYPYPEGTVVSVVAIPAEGWRFVRWEVDDMVGRSNPLVVQMNTNLEVVAVFAEGGGGFPVLPVLMVAVPIVASLFGRRR